MSIVVKVTSKRHMRHINGDGERLMPNEEEFIAAMRFKNAAMARAQRIWPEIAATANATWAQRRPLPTDTNTSFAFFVASLFVEARSLYTVYKNHQATRLWAYVTNSFAVEPQYGISALESLDSYSTIWDQCRYSRQHLDPAQGVAYALLHRLDIPTNDVPSRVIEVIASAFASSPPWWEQFACQTQLVPSDVPTELSAFRLFAEENMSYPSDDDNAKAFVNQMFALGRDACPSIAEAVEMSCGGTVSFPVNEDVYVEISLAIMGTALAVLGGYSQVMTAERGARIADACKASIRSHYGLTADEIRGINDAIDQYTGAFNKSMQGRANPFGEVSGMMFMRCMGKKAYTLCLPGSGAINPMTHQMVGDLMTMMVTEAVSFWKGK